MQEKLQQLKNQALPAIASSKNEAELTDLENKYLGRKNGELTELMKGLKDLNPEEKKNAGQLLNEIKKELEEAINKKREELSNAGFAQAIAGEKADLSQPYLPKKERGHLHPNSIVQKELEDLFTSMGFMVLDGPELESDYYNFEAINIPPTHPARESQDTFYIKNHENWLVRTHTSSNQVRAMEKYGAPLKMITPGRCFRNEATDARHEHTFYQLEGVVVDKDINFGHMKAVLETVAQKLFGPEIKVRLRPKFYPFVEPGVNGEVTCLLCGGKGCGVCKHTGWMEIFGAGMIHPNVLRAGGLDPQVYSGFAFGFGLTRMVMLKYGIDDVRLLQSGDLRFVRQF
ncbi:MAG TPA: phenylalanine--tRNA ligase subunit alpha [Candidatus Magasanikbacteria bacterium]|nr:phenylalanine--tRNA ligase subunit alpha [Candidatus Magasanikbacteria bacterium]